MVAVRVVAAGVPVATGAIRWSSTRTPCRGVAETTGGQYYRAENAGQLQEALGDLPSHVTVVTEHVDIASWFAAVGGLLVAAALALSLWWNRVRTPGRVGRAG